MKKSFYYRSKQFTLTAGEKEIFVQVQYDMRNSVHYKKQLTFYSKNFNAFEYCDKDDIKQPELHKAKSQAQKEFENEFMCHRID